MPRLKVLTADELIKILRIFNFEIVSQKGSHIKLSRTNPLGKQILTIPNHKPLAKGTLKAIFNHASKFVPQEELQSYFYSE